ncbi:uncharacterized protein [Salminus brasiliensis]|uniref:uncharacterized protein n=1 Tax=Salminus brasiliensis TaxID=930266 RepID=UPI003B82DBD0
MAAVPKSGFKLVGRPPEKAPVGSVAILYCYLSSKKSAVDMEIRWFRETNCVCLYKDRKITAGRGYAGRVNLFVHELDRGNVSLLLRECRECDIGHYLCQVTCGDGTEEFTARVWWRPLHRSIFGCSKGGVIPHVSIEQWFRKWTEEERLKMEDSALLTEYNTDVKSLKKELKEKQNMLETNEQQLRNLKLEWERAEDELQKKCSQLQMTVVVLEQLKTELSEKTKQLQEKESLLMETDTRLMERDKQVKEKDRLLEEKNMQLQEMTESSVRRMQNMELENPPTTGELSVPGSPIPASELRLVLLGKSGCEKSVAGNTILGWKEGSQARASEVRQHSEIRQVEVAGRRVTVVDTPDWFSPEFSLEELQQDVGHCVRLSAPGPHAFLLVIPVNHFTGEEIGMLEEMEEIFGEKCWRNTMILFTITDEVPEKIIEMFVQSGDQDVQRLVKKCGDRFHYLKLGESGDGSEISQLLEKIEKMVEGNEEGFYSTKMFFERKHQIKKMDKNITLEEEKKPKEEEEEEDEEEEDEEEENEEEEMKEMLEDVVQESLRKIEGVIQEHEQHIRELKSHTTELERRIQEQKDDKQKRELEGQLKENLQKRTKLENIVNSLKEMSEKEKREMDERHRQEIRDMYKGKIQASKLKMEEEFSRQMEEKDREVEKLKQRLSDLEEARRQDMRLNKTKVVGSGGSSKKRAGVKKLLQSELMN